MSKIAEVRAGTHSRPFWIEFVRLGLGINTRGGCVVMRTIDDGCVGRGKAHHCQNPGAIAGIAQRRLGSLLKGTDSPTSPVHWSSRLASADSIRSVPNSPARPVRWRTCTSRRLPSPALPSIHRFLVGIRLCPAQVESLGAGEQVASTGQ
jgi:hypothetical protein